MAKTKSEEAKKKEYDRKKREERKYDPVKLEEMRQKEKLKYLKKKEKKQVKSVKEMSSREHRQKNKQWKKNAKTYRENMKKKKMNLQQFFSGQTPSNSNGGSTSVMDIVDQPSTSRQNVGCKRIRRDRCKLFRDNEFLKGKVQISNRKAEMYKKRYHALLKKYNMKTESNLTPRSKVNKLVGCDKVSLEVRKKLIFGEVVNAELASSFKDMRKSQKGRQMYYRILRGKVLKKYRMLHMAKETILRYRNLNNNASKEGNYITCNKRGKYISNKVKEDVANFFDRDENSRLCPGKKDCVTKSKVKKQKRLLSDTEKVLHKKFLQEAGYFLSYQSFCRLKPFWVKKPTVEERNTTACLIHSNMKINVSKLNEIGTIDFKTPSLLLEYLCCNKNSIACLQRKCKTCKSRTILYKIEDKTALVNIKRWIWEKKNSINDDGKKKQTRKPLKKEIETNAVDLASDLQTSLPTYMSHVANILHQYKEIRNLKENLSDDSALIHADFSENYKCKYGEEIQTVHYGSGREQITLHTVVLYHHEGPDVTPVLFCSMSKSMRHDPAAIWAHLKPIFKYVLEKNPNLKNVHILSDGPSTQYKNKSMFYMISNHVNEFLPDISMFTWNYFEAGHGKGAPDGVGGTLKRTADRLVAEGKDVENFETFISAMIEHCPGVKIIKVTAEEISDVDKYLKNKQQIKAFKGTQKVHQVLYKKEKESLSIRSLSCFKCMGKCSHFSLGVGFKREGKVPVTDGGEVDADNIELPKSAEKEVENNDRNIYKKGEWVLVWYDNELYPGEIIEALANSFYIVNAMHPSEKLEGRFKWPNPKQDIHQYHVTDIDRKIEPPEPCDNRSLLFTFPSKCL